MYKMYLVCVRSVYYNYILSLLCVAYITGLCVAYNTGLCRLSSGAFLVPIGVNCICIYFVMIVLNTYHPLIELQIIRDIHYGCTSIVN